ncbi:MAG: aldehyde dehydrogenase family protein, partial [Archangium sp.]
AALVAGNAVVFKPATDTPYSGRLLAECFRDGGVPVALLPEDALRRLQQALARALPARGQRREALGWRT